MKAKTKVVYGLNLDTDMLEDVAASWARRGFDTEEFFVPDVDAADFRVIGEDGEGDDITEEEHECRYIRPVLRPVPRRQVRYEKAVSLSRDLGLLQKGERIDVIMSGKFIMGDFIEGYMVEHNLHAKRLLISTLSYNENNIDSLRNLLDGGFVDNIDIVVSSYFYAHERHKLIKYAYQELDNEQGRFQLAVCNVHTKTYQFCTDEGLHIIMQGSGNMRAGANFEQMVMEENEEVFRFYEGFYNEILKEYPTIQKDKKYLKTWFQPEYDDKKEPN